MRLINWKYLSNEEKEALIRDNGKDVNYQLILDSMAYFDAVIARTCELKFNEGRSRYGMKAVAEHLRWCSKAEDGTVLFKVNNNLTSTINHLLVRIFPELEGFYSCRSLS